MLRVLVGIYTTLWILWTLIRIFFKLVLLAIVHIARLCLRKFRYQFFAVGHYGFAALLTAAGRRKIRKDALLRQKIAHSFSYEEWLHHNRQREVHEEREIWRRTEDSKNYSVKLLKDTVAHLRVLRESGDVHATAMALNIHMVRNFAGICNPTLYGPSGAGTKLSIEEYLNEVTESVDFVVDPDSGLSMEERMKFVLESKKSIGRTALCLSGGGLIALYHLGVVSTLFDLGLLPQVISGTSGGSIIAGMLGVASDEEIKGYARPDVAEMYGKRWVEPFSVNFRRFLKEGVWMDSENYMDTLKAYYGDLTFREAYQKTGRIVSIAVSSPHGHGHGCPPLLNYITSPQVLVRSAVAASCALTMVMKPVQILAKDKNNNVVPWTQAHFIDGSFQNDLPMRRLSELFGVNHFIVSQTNPHVVPFLDDQPDSAQTSVLWRLQRRLYIDLMYHISKVAKRFPFGLGMIADSFLSQSFTGSYQDVTVFPDFSWRDYLCIIAQPSRADMERFYIGGLRAIWPKIARIKTQYQIEHALQMAESQLMEELQRASQKRTDSPDGAKKFANQARARMPVSRNSFELILAYIHRLQEAGEWTDKDTSDLLGDEQVALLKDEAEHASQSPQGDEGVWEGTVSTCN